MLNRLRAIWSKGYLRGSLGKSHQNGDYLKQAMRKSFPTKFELAAFRLLVHCSTTLAKLEKTFPRMPNSGY